MRVLIILFGLVLSTGTYAQAPEESSIGSMKFVDAVSGDSLSLSDYQDRSLLVLIFTSNYCPYSRKYESRIKQIHESYASKGLQLLLVNPNAGDNDSLQEMQKKAAEHDYKFPYLSDKEQQLTDLLGAQRTPEAFLLKAKDFELLYRGAIDDNPQAPAYVESSYLVQAIDQALSGDATTPKKVKVIGCMIKKGS